MAMLTIENVQEYDAQILEYGVQDFDSLITKTTSDIHRKLEIEWWQLRQHRHYDVTVRGGYIEDMDTTKLDETQWTRSAVFHCMAYYILPQLTTFTPEGDRFREMIQYYKDRFTEEFELELRRGVKYDDNNDSVYQTSEKQAVNHGRLVR